MQNSAYKVLLPQLAWTFEGRPLDARMLPLVRAISKQASLQAAVKTLGLSYRSAWNLLGKCELLLGAPLIALQQGRGATLTDLGAALLDADHAAQRAASALASTHAVRLPQSAPTGESPLTLRIRASHDLVLARLREADAARGDLHLDVTFQGSLESLAEYARGEADAGGFHVPRGKAGERHRKAIARWLSPGRDSLVRFIEREQGVILPRGNPMRVRSLQDLARKHLRVINRQRGSGTRLLVDELLRQAAIEPAAIPGYESEEFTHLAVAATVAAGKADAAFGVRAAASQFDLDFLPLCMETYWFVISKRILRREAGLRFLKLLKSASLKAIVAGLPGYSARLCGTVHDVTAATGSSPEAARRSRKPR